MLRTMIAVLMFSSVAIGGQIDQRGTARDGLQGTHETEIARFITQLGSKVFAEREAAREAIEKIGIPALIALRRAAITNPDAEVRRSASSLVARLEAIHELDLAYSWFDGLGYPDLEKCLFVRVATGYAYQEEGKQLTNSYCFGFLVQDNGHTFNVLSPALAKKTYTKSKADKPEVERVGFEKWGLEKYVSELLKSVNQPEDPDAFPPRFGQRISEAAELFVLARACAAQGHKKLGEELIAQAKKKARDSNQDKADSFLETIANDIAQAEMWRWVEAFGDPGISRKELLARFSWIAKNFPQSPHASRAKETATLLKKMVAEDEAQARRPAKPAKDLTKKERIADLIFRLRDQNGHQWSEPGSCDIFATDFMADKKSEKSPAHQLVEIGYDAVPQLIAVMEDERFTRSVGCHRSFYFSHYVLRVGDCAVAILERISGKSLWQARTTASAALKDGEGGSAKEKAQSWWEEFQKKGERQLLIEGVRRGDRDSQALVERLVGKYPESALPAIREGVKQDKEGWVAATLVANTSKLKGDGPVVFLREQLSHPMHEVRVEAARGLLKRDQEEAVSAMIREWNKEKTSRELTNFLIWCGRVEAIKAIAKDLSKREPDVVLEVIEAAYSAWGWEEYEKKSSPAHREAIDELLVGLLDDVRERTGMSGSWGNASFSDPRLCDLSAHVLSLRWKQPGSFDLSGSLGTRDRQRIELKNVWLKKQGRPQLPLPVRKTIVQLPDKQVQALLRQYEAASSTEERQEAGQRVLALGLPALPSVRERIRELPAGHSALADLNILAAQLGCIVDEVTFSKESAQPDKDFRKQVDAFRGKPLTSSSLVELILGLCTKLPPGVTGISLAIQREGDGTGMTLNVTLRPGKTSQDAMQKGWDTHHNIIVGGKNSGFSSGSCSWDYGLSWDNWNSFAKALRKTLESSPDQSLSIRVGMIQSK